MIIIRKSYRAIQKSFYQVGHDSGNECRWAAAYLAHTGDSEISLEKKSGVSLTQNNFA
jgi:hypothetical protein